MIDVGGPFSNCAQRDVEPITLGAMHTRWFQQPLCRAFPIAHLMRQAFPEYWLRIHSQPESKRYPEDEDERQIVIERYSLFGSALLGEGSECLIIKSLFNHSLQQADFMPELQWTAIHTVAESDEDDWCSWVAHTVWDPVAFRTLLLAIADDRERLVAFVSTVTGCIFIPYDGGADGFSLDATALHRLREEFASWQSKHPNGL